MPPSTLSSLQARIRQLEADNESLSHAASEAAALVEEYAADAAAFRRSQPADATLVNELTDATRRKDRRIQRLTSVLDVERAKVEALEKKAREMKDMLTVADEMERTLRESLGTLQGDGGRRDNMMREERVWQIVMKGLQAYFPGGLVNGDFAAFEALRNSVQVFEMRERLRGKIMGGRFVWEGAILEVLEQGYEDVEQGLRWCFEAPMQRGEMLEKRVGVLKERMEGLLLDVENGEAGRWSEEFGRMKAGLLEMALEGVLGVVPQGEGIGGGGVDQLLKDSEEALCRRGEEVKRRLRTVEGIDEGEMGNVRDIQMKLNVAKNGLARKTAELEDMGVRMKVFEERLTAAVEEERELRKCRERVRELEEEVLKEREAVAENHEVGGMDSKDNLSPKKMGITEGARKRGYYEGFDSTKEATRLRRILVQRNLADLQNGPWRTDKQRSSIPEKNINFRKTMRNALEDARLSASNAAIIPLDPETLQPKKLHKVQTRKPSPWESLASKDFSNIERDITTRHGVRRQEIALGNVGQDLPAIVSILRQSFCQ